MALSTLLIPEPPLTVLPNLAVQIGLNEAIFLQQVQYWISREAGILDEFGCRWIYNTVKQWRDQFPFWSESTIKRTIRSLEEQEVLLSTTIGDAFNKTKAYTINYERIEELGQKIVHEQFRTSIESVQQRVSSPPMKDDDEEPSASPHTLETTYTPSVLSSDDTESQNIKADEPLEEVNLTLREGQKVNSGEPIEGVNLTLRESQIDPSEEAKLTPSKRPSENPVTARAWKPSSRAHVTETTTENTHRIRETTTGDVRSFCAELGVSGASLERFIRSYGEAAVGEKACLLEIAMQTKSIRNPTGWLHAALRDGYTFTPVRPAAQETAKAQKPPPRPYVPPAAPSVEKEQDAPVTGNLQEALSRMEDSSVFAKEFLLRQRGNAEGRASP